MNLKLVNTLSFVRTLCLNPDKRRTLFHSDETGFRIIYPKKEIFAINEITEETEKWNTNRNENVP